MENIYLARENYKEAKHELIKDFIWWGAALVAIAIIIIICLGGGESVVESSRNAAEAIAESPRQDIAVNVGLGAGFVAAIVLSAILAAGILAFGIRFYVEKIRMWLISSNIWILVFSLLISYFIAVISGLIYFPYCIIKHTVDFAKAKNCYEKTIAVYEDEISEQNSYGNAEEEYPEYISEKNAYMYNVSESNVYGAEHMDCYDNERQETSLPYEEDVIYCPMCGRMHRTSDRFCGNCGTRLYIDIA